FRTSYFPGLGWMMRRQLWEEIGNDWPMQSWDHWMRLNSTSKGRECIVPEVNRNRNIGERGANMERSVFKKFLQKMTWNSKMVTDYGDLRYLLAANYNSAVRDLLKRSQSWDWQARGMNVPSKGVFLLAYTADVYTQLARRLRIWPFPRAHHYHLTILPYRESTLLLADRRFCSYLPDVERIHPSPGLQAWAAEQGQSCTDACRQQDMECRTQDFWFINSCEVLREHFPCTHGCAIELGADLPNYVMGADLQTFQTCLVFQKQPICKASHASTARLCPCVPLPEAALQIARRSAANLVTRIDQEMTSLGALPDESVQGATNDLEHASLNPTPGLANSAAGASHVLPRPLLDLPDSASEDSAAAQLNALDGNTPAISYQGGSSAASGDENALGSEEVPGRTDASNGSMAPMHLQDLPMLAETPPLDVRPHDVLKCRCWLKRHTEQHLSRQLLPVIAIKPLHIVLPWLLGVTFETPQQQVVLIPGGPRPNDLLQPARAIPRSALSASRA
ncbi:hypothetical protein WJX84_002304, partial [Apatococcus fuscideae]